MPEEIKLDYFNNKTFPCVFDSLKALYIALSPNYKGKDFSQPQRVAFLKVCHKYLELEISGRKHTVLRILDSPNFAATKRKDRSGNYLPWTARLLADHITSVAKEGGFKNDCYEIKFYKMYSILGLTNNRTPYLSEKTEFPLVIYGISKDDARHFLSLIKNQDKFFRRVKDAIDKINSSFEGIRVKDVLFINKEIVKNGKYKTISEPATQEEIARFDECIKQALSEFKIKTLNDAYKIGSSNFFNNVDRLFTEGTNIIGKHDKYYAYIDKEAIEDGRYLLDEKTIDSYLSTVNKNILDKSLVDTNTRQSYFIDNFWPCGHTRKNKHKFSICIQDCCLSSSDDEESERITKVQSLLTEYYLNIDKKLVDGLIARAKEIAMAA